MSGKETKWIKGIPLANKKLKDNFEVQIKDDRRKAIAIGSAFVFLILGARVAYVNAQKDDVNPEPAQVPKYLDVGEDGYCLFPDMTTNPAEINVLQEFLIQNDYYEGEMNGEYTKETAQAVAEFQQVAKSEGRYDLIIDGMAEFYTCKAMGEPYFVFED